jgi:hypothetical protein
MSGITVTNVAICRSTQTAPAAMQQCNAKTLEEPLHGPIVGHLAEKE